MWIAKPLNALTPQERQQWCDTLAYRAAHGDDVPIAQTLRWAEATECLGTPSYVVFSPDEQAGGVLFEAPSPDPDDHDDDEKTFLYCINGPLIDWKDPEKNARQLATFAMGSSKLTKKVKTLSLQPRWIEPPEGSASDPRIAEFPVEPTTLNEAATWITPLPPEPNARLKRTLKKSREALIETEWHDLKSLKNLKILEDFVTNLELSAEDKFYAPPLKWFQTLIKNTTPEPLRFYLSRSRHVSLPENEAAVFESLAENFICVYGNTAHYFFGYENRDPSIPAAVSLAAIAHEHAMLELQKLGITHYDWNGFIKDCDPTDPYYGVNEFKRQWSGSSITYIVPDFRIEL